MTNVHRRVRRLLRWYPSPWRARYGEEFAELLTAHIADEPHSTVPAPSTSCAKGWARAGETRSG